MLQFSDWVLEDISNGVYYMFTAFDSLYPLRIRINCDGSKDTKLFMRV